MQVNKSEDMAVSIVLRSTTSQGLTYWWCYWENASQMDAIRGIHFYYTTIVSILIGITD